MKYSPVIPAVTHVSQYNLSLISYQQVYNLCLVQAIIKSYYDGPMLSTSLHNVGAIPPTIPSHSIPIANSNRVNLNYFYEKYGKKIVFNNTFSNKIIQKYQL